MGRSRALQISVRPHVQHGSARTARQGLPLDPSRKILMRFFAARHAVLAALFACVALILRVIAARTGRGGPGAEAIGLPAVALVSLQIAQAVHPRPDDCDGSADGAGSVVSGLP
jgi:hypothetical protein